MFSRPGRETLLLYFALLIEKYRVRRVFCIDAHVNARPGSGRLADHLTLGAPGECGNPEEISKACGSPGGNYPYSSSTRSEGNVLFGLKFLVIEANALQTVL
jgi:hypothetical protein